MAEYRLLKGNAVEALKDVEDDSVDCCVTSPPYYGLRDYGTGHWEGGDPGCNHEDAKLSTRFERKMTDKSLKQMTSKGTDVKRYKDVCPRCGAVLVDEQIGLEESPEAYVMRLVDVFREVRRVLKPSGTLWVNIGDTYNVGSYKKDEKGSGKGKQGTNKGSFANVVVRPMAENCKVKDLIGIPWMLAFELRNDGWYLRQDIIWSKPNPMPEPVKDRCTRSHEHIFLLAKKPIYYFDNEAIRPMDAYGDGEGNKRDVWVVGTSAGYNDGDGSHYATYNPKLIEPCILAGSPEGGVVLDPFNGTGTTGIVAMGNGRDYIGVDLKEEYIEMTKKRFENEFAQCSLFY